MKLNYKIPFASNDTNTKRSKVVLYFDDIEVDYAQLFSNGVNAWDFQNLNLEGKLFFVQEG
jgi:hypothetical protein